jgi:hypothetical protein
MLQVSGPDQVDIGTMWHTRDVPLWINPFLDVSSADSHLQEAILLLVSTQVAHNSTVSWAETKHPLLKDLTTFHWLVGVKQSKHGLALEVVLSITEPCGDFLLVDKQLEHVKGVVNWGRLDLER